MAIRVLGALPFGRALAPIDGIEPQKVDRIAGAQPDGRVRFRREFAVQIDISPAGPIEELEIAEQRDLRPDILDVENFSPAVVPDYNVRNKPVAVEPLTQF